MHDVPHVTNERKTPSFGMLIKKSINIITKKKEDIKKRNFAKDLTYASLSLYLKNSFALINSDTDISTLPHKIYLYKIDPDRHPGKSIIIK